MGTESAEVTVTEMVAGDALAPAAVRGIVETAEAAVETTMSTILEPALGAATAVAPRVAVDEAASEAAEAIPMPEAPIAKPWLRKLFKRARRRTESTSVTSLSRSDGTISRTSARKVG